MGMEDRNFVMNSGSYFIVVVLIVITDNYRVHIAKDLIQPLSFGHVCKRVLPLRSGVIACAAEDCDIASSDGLETSNLELMFELTFHGRRSS